MISLLVFCLKGQPPRKSNSLCRSIRKIKWKNPYNGWPVAILYDLNVAQGHEDLMIPKGVLPGAHLFPPPFISQVHSPVLGIDQHYVHHIVVGVHLQRTFIAAMDTEDRKGFH